MSEVTRRALERCRRQREQELETAERRLAAAEKGLHSLGRLGRRSQRAELQAEISYQRTAVRLARSQFTEFPLEQPEQRPTRPARTRLEPETRVLTRTCDREFGIELDRRAQ